jgi:hypothetical protein
LIVARFIGQHINFIIRCNKTPDSREGIGSGKYIVSARDCGYDGPPFIWDEERRFLLRCEPDAAYFHLYGISTPDVDYIMDTFPIVKRKDQTKYGSYRTKEKILEIYEKMSTAIADKKSYETVLDHPPADPSVAHPKEQIPKTKKD